MNPLFPQNTNSNSRQKAMVELAIEKAKRRGFRKRRNRKRWGNLKLNINKLLQSIANGCAINRRS